MTHTQEKRFQRELRAKRDELLRQVSESRNGLALDRSADSMDQIRSAAERDLAMRNVDRTCKVLRLVEGALREIDEKTFGVCAECGETIPIKRLEAVPWSPFCVRCQDRVERREGANGKSDEMSTYALAS